MKEIKIQLKKRNITGFDTEDHILCAEVLSIGSVSINIAFNGFYLFKSLVRKNDKANPQSMADLGLTIEDKKIISEVIQAVNDMKGWDNPTEFL